MTSRYLIKRVKCVADNTFAAYYVELPTDNIEATRKELAEFYKCDRIILVYDELN